MGIDKDTDGGMTVAGSIIPETETCEGWNTQRLEGLWIQTHAEWEKYGHSVSQLPDDIRTRYMRIQYEAVDNARKAGRDASLQDDD
jgi:hypothetical protein